MSTLEFNFASMNSGKSTRLIQTYHNYKERGLSPVAITAAIDTRSGNGKIKSRIGLEIPALTFDKDTDIIELVNPYDEDVETLNEMMGIDDAPNMPDIVLIDEAQFLSKEQVRQCAELVDKHDITVACYGLKTDFKGELFEGSRELLCLADTFNEYSGVCWCGGKASFNARVIGGSVERAGEQVQIGDAEYVPLCRKHFISGKIRP